MHFSTDKTHKTKYEMDKTYECSIGYLQMIFFVEA